jgi:hypothetical protein
MTKSTTRVALVSILALVLLPACAARGATVATLQLRPTSTVADGVTKLAFDTASLAGKKVVHAELTMGRKGSGDVSITPKLLLRAPWFNAFDATGLVKGGGRVEVTVAGPVAPESVRLLVTYEGVPGAVPAQVKGLRVVHRAGQTFITFDEIDDRSADAAPKWGDLKAKLAAMDKGRAVRYLVLRHAERITVTNLGKAERLARVEPMSAYNVLGRSVDELIPLVRKRAMDDDLLARRLAKTRELFRYTPSHPAMAEVPIARLAIEDGKPLAPKLGLYVHQPAKAGKAFYAVVVCVDGVTNTKDLTAANSLAVPVDETVGVGVPVLQGEVKTAVFFDYPGKRTRYVQWAAPPLANLPNQYYNWGVFAPRDYDKGAKRLCLFFHDGNQRYLKQPWPHRQDQVIIAPHDAPFASYGIGYNDALGTLKPFKSGTIRPFFARRMDAALEWAVKEFKADPARVAVGGNGYWGGTAALQYGVRRPGRVAYVMSGSSPDPNPRETPDKYVHYPRGRPRSTPRRGMDRVWGRPEWKLPFEGGKKSIWDEANLPAFVRAAKGPLPYISLGSGSMSVTWKTQTQLMIAYKETHNAFMARFYWGGTPLAPLPSGTFEPRADAPMLACWPLGHSPNGKFFAAQFFTGKRGYGGGSRVNDRNRWEPDTIVDTPEKLEMTFYSARVSYAGNVTAATAVRNAQKFKPGPGEKLTWKAGKAGGEITVGKDGLILIPRLTFVRKPTRLVITRTQAN